MSNHHDKHHDNHHDNTIRNNATKDRIYDKENHEKNVPSVTYIGNHRSATVVNVKPVGHGDPPPPSPSKTSTSTSTRAGTDVPSRPSTTPSTTTTTEEEGNSTATTKSNSKDSKNSNHDDSNPPPFPQPRALSDLLRHSTEDEETGVGTTATAATTTGTGTGMGMSTTSTACTVGDHGGRHEYAGDGYGRTLEDEEGMDVDVDVDEVEEMADHPLPQDQPRLPLQRVPRMCASLPVTTLSNLQGLARQIIQEGTQAFQDLHRTNQALAILQEESTGKDRELERLRSSNDRSRATIAKLLQAVQTSREGRKEDAAAKLTEARLRADLWHRTTERDEAQQALAATQRHVEVVQTERRRWKQECAVATSQQKELAREHTTARSLAHSLQGSHEADLEYYKRKVNELNIHIRGLCTVLTEKNRQLEELRRQQEQHHLAEHRFDSFRQHADDGGGGGGNTKKKSGSNHRASSAFFASATTGVMGVVSSSGKKHKKQHRHQENDKRGAPTNNATFSTGGAASNNSSNSLRNSTTTTSATATTFIDNSKVAPRTWS